MTNNAGDGQPTKPRSAAKRRTPADIIRIHDVDYVQDQTGELVPYVPPPGGSLGKIVPVLLRTVIGVMAVVGTPNDCWPSPKAN